MPRTRPSGEASAIGWRKPSRSILASRPNQRAAAAPVTQCVSPVCVWCAWLAMGHSRPNNSACKSPIRVYNYAENLTLHAVQQYDTVSGGGGYWVSIFLSSKLGKRSHPCCPAVSPPSRTMDYPHTGPSHHHNTPKSKERRRINTLKRNTVLCVCTSTSRIQIHPSHEGGGGGVGLGKNPQSCAF